MRAISKVLGAHYSEQFSLHGPTSAGADWGSDQTRALLRYEKMLAVVDQPQASRPSMLDVGCGYGGLYQHAASKKIDLHYTGIDVAENMIEWATANIPAGRFIKGDILDFPFEEKFDYVVCNGILTQKLGVPTTQMDEFAALLIRRMFSLCEIGLAFNIMTTKVNYFSNNLYYRNPAELLAWCLSEIAAYIKIDHAYPLYEYTLYLYHQPQVFLPRL